MISKEDLNDELRPEYDLSKLKNVVVGKYVERYRKGTHVVLLEPDIAEFFPDSKAVNEALRALISERGLISMQTIEHFRHLFAYNDWANRRIVEALAENPVERARQIAAHLLITEKEYFERLYGKDSTGFDFWQDLSIAECDALRRETSASFSKLLSESGEDDLETYAKYKNSRGDEFENTWRELCSQVLLHSATHRGNIMIKIREAGFAPPAIDYIIYLREI